MKKISLLKTITIIIIIITLAGMYFIKSRHSTDVEADKNQFFPALVDYGSHG